MNDMELEVAILELVSNLHSRSTRLRTKRFVCDPRVTIACMEACGSILVDECTDDTYEVEATCKTMPGVARGPDLCRTINEACVLAMREAARHPI